MHDSSPYSGLALGMDQAPNIKPSDLSTMMSTNVLGLINTTQAILSIMKSRGAKGSGDIINIGSIAGRTPYAGGSVYCASKAAVRSFTDALRKELAETRIRVMEIDPGKVQTEFSTVRFYGDQEKADGVYKAFEPLTPGDVAELVVFAAGRRENVVIADALICPNHQVCLVMFIVESQLICQRPCEDPRAAIVPYSLYSLPGSETRWRAGGAPRNALVASG